MDERLVKSAVVVHQVLLMVVLVMMMKPVSLAVVIAMVCATVRSDDVSFDRIRNCVLVEAELVA